MSDTQDDALADEIHKAAQRHAGHIHGYVIALMVKAADRLRSHPRVAQPTREQIETLPTHDAQLTLGDQEAGRWHKVVRLSDLLALYDAASRVAQEPKCDHETSRHLDESFICAHGFCPRCWVKHDCEFAMVGPAQENDHE